MITIQKFNQLISDITGKRTPHNELLQVHLRTISYRDHTETELRTELNYALGKLPKRVNQVCDNCYWGDGEQNLTCIFDDLLARTDLIHWLDLNLAVNILDQTLIHKVEKKVKDGQICDVCHKSLKGNWNQKKYLEINLDIQKEEIPENERWLETQDYPSIQSQIELMNRDKVNEDQFSCRTNPLYPPKSGSPIKILSFGAGKDSFVEYLLNADYYDLIIFADTGNEQPETYAFLDYLVRSMPIEHQAKFIIISSNYLGSIYDYYYNKQTVPMPFVTRDCTDKFKIRPIRHFLRGRQGDDKKGGVFKKNAKFEMAIGINYSEQTRARGIPTKEDGRLFETDVQYCFNSYPLIEKKIERNHERRIIEEMGMLVPVKSGCVICPFTTKKGFAELKVKHPELYAKVEALMLNSTAEKDIYKLIKSEGLDKYFDYSNQKTEENRCGCMNGSWSTNEDNDETMQKSNKW